MLVKRPSGAERAPPERGPDVRASERLEVRIKFIISRAPPAALSKPSELHPFPQQPQSSLRHLSSKAQRRHHSCSSPARFAPKPHRAPATASCVRPSSPSPHQAGIPHCLAAPADRALQSLPSPASLSLHTCQIDGPGPPAGPKPVKTDSSRLNH